MPVKVLVGLAGVVIVPPVPETIDQSPVPTVGVFAASVTVVSPHVVTPVWSGPASEVEGSRLKFIRTSSVEGAHGALVMVHRN